MGKIKLLFEKCKIIEMVTKAALNHTHRYNLDTMSNLKEGCRGWMDGRNV